MSKSARDVIAEQVVGPSPGVQLGDAEAEAIVASLDAAGFVIVPKEPTDAMIDAGSAAKFESTERGNSNTVSAYRAMIAAAERGV